MELAPRGADDVEITAPKETVWDLLVDSSRLTEWSPAVTATAGEREALHATRIVEVRLGRRRGRLGQRCVVFEPLRRIGWRVERDSFGAWKQLDFGLEFTLEDAGEGRTRLVGTTYCMPRTMLARAYDRFVLRRRVRRLRQALLANLQRVAERQSTQPA